MSRTRRSFCVTADEMPNVPSRPVGASRRYPFLSSGCRADYTITMFGFDFRQGQRLCFVNPAYLAAAGARARERCSGSVIHFLIMGHLGARTLSFVTRKGREQ